MAFQDPNAAALAAGATPGQTATIGDGAPFVVQPAPGAPGAPASGEGASAPSKSTFKEKDPAGKKTEYLGNHVVTTESGHMIEIDNTPGDRRIHVYHASGTFIEIMDDGARISKVQGLTQEFLNKGKDEKITGNFNISVTGDVNMLVTGNYRQEIKGNYELVTHGSVKIKTAGNYLQETNGDQRVQINGKTSHRSSGDRETITGGKNIDTVNGDQIETVGADNTQVVSGVNTTMTGGEHSVSAGGTMGLGAASVGIASTGTTSLLAMGELKLGFSDEVGGPVSKTTIKGTTIELNP